MEVLRNLFYNLYATTGYIILKLNKNRDTDTINYQTYDTNKQMYVEFILLSAFYIKFLGEIKLL